MKKILITALTAIFALNVQGQTLRTSYFMDKYHMSHQRNPAMSPSMGYVNLPVVGNLFLGLESNIKLADFLYPVGPKNDRQLGTFMHPEISSNQFLRKIGRLGETVGADANISVLGFGFYTKHNRFWSADLNVKVNAGANIPKDVFAFMKQLDLGEDGGFDWKNLNVAARGYVELAIGHARDIEILGHDFRMGAKIKPLVGLVDGRIKVDDLTLRTTAEKWTLNADAYASVLGGLVTLEEKRDAENNLDGVDFGLVDLGNVEIMDLINFGVALDLGVVYNMDNLLEALLPSLPLKGFTVSLGITDLGFIRYKQSTGAAFDKNFWYDGVKVVREKDEEGKGSWKEDLDYLKDQFDEIAKNIEITGEGGKVSRGLRTTTNIGLEYSFLNDKMSAGLLYSTHWGLPRRFNELTLSYNLRPCRWYSLSLSTSVWNGFFRTAGWAMNFTPKYVFNFFIGMDYFPFAWTPQIGDNWPLPWGLPVYNANFNLNLGMSIPLGGNRHAKYGGTKRERRAERRATREQEGLQQDVRNVYQSVELE
ncbi:MAG: DUF5723 family protein [Bacteroidales bacterium]|nr:DUF5723 family protein [Bacteroidales bacterium]